MRTRCQDSIDELERLIVDNKEFPVTYNHYYTDTIQKKQTDRMREVLDQAVDHATSQTPHEGCPCRSGQHASTNVDTGAVVAHLHCKMTRDMVQYSCEILLDCVQSMYKVGAPSCQTQAWVVTDSDQDQMKTFVQIVTRQAVERHMVRDLEQIILPLVVSELNDEEVMKAVSEPSSVKRQREFLSDRLEKLKTGQDQFRDVMGVIC